MGRLIAPMKDKAVVLVLVQIKVPGLRYSTNTKSLIQQTAGQDTKDLLVQKPKQVIKKYVLAKKSPYSM
jgi:hypothetical protein